MRAGLALFVCACAASGPPVSYATPVAGLAIALEVPDSARAGDTATARLHLRNTTGSPVRVYFLAPEFFRSFQSSLYVRDASGKLAGVPEVSPPHGYLPKESDFPLLAAGETKTFTQSFKVPAAPGTYTVEWTYSNTVTEWKGGAQTLDGPMPTLLGGGPIPYIWTGKIVTSATLVVGSP